MMMMMNPLLTIPLTLLLLSTTTTTTTKASNAPVQLPYGYQSTSGPFSNEFAGNIRYDHRTDLIYISSNHDGNCILTILRPPMSTTTTNTESMEDGNNMRIMHKFNFFDETKQQQRVQDGQSAMLAEECHSLSSSFFEREHSDGTTKLETELYFGGTRMYTDESIRPYVRKVRLEMEPRYIGSNNKEEEDMVTMIPAMHSSADIEPFPDSLDEDTDVIVDVPGDARHGSFLTHGSDTMGMIVYRMAGWERGREFMSKLDDEGGTQDWIKAFSNDDGKEKVPVNVASILYVPRGGDEEFDVLLLAGSTSGWGLGTAPEMDEDEEGERVDDLDGFITKIAAVDGEPSFIERDEAHGGYFEEYGTRLESDDVEDDIIVNMCISRTEGGDAMSEEKSERYFYVVGMTRGSVDTTYPASSARPPLEEQAEFDGIVDAPAYHAVLGKYDVDTLEPVWVRQLGAQFYEDSPLQTDVEGVSCAVSMDGTEVFLVGNVRDDGVVMHDTFDDYENFSSGDDDFFVAKFDVQDGEILFLRQHGTIADDTVSGADVDGQGNLVVLGTTGGALVRWRSPEDDSQGSQEDMFVMSVDGVTGDVLQSAEEEMEEEDEAEDELEMEKFYEDQQNDNGFEQTQEDLENDQEQENKELEQDEEEEDEEDEDEWSFEQDEPESEDNSEQENYGEQMELEAAKEAEKEAQQNQQQQEDEDEEEEEEEEDEALENYGQKKEQEEAKQAEQDALQNQQGDGQTQQEQPIQPHQPHEPHHETQKNQPPQQTSPPPPPQQQPNKGNDADTPTDGYVQQDYTPTKEEEEEEESRLQPPSSSSTVDDEGDNAKKEPNIWAEELDEEEDEEEDGSESNQSTTKPNLQGTANNNNNNNNNIDNNGGGGGGGVSTREKITNTIFICIILALLSYIFILRSNQRKMELETVHIDANDSLAPSNSRLTDIS